MKILFILIITILPLSACQSAKDAMTLKKKASGDEFLVEKKSPLVLPPEYGKLPLPDGSEFNNNTLEEAQDIENLINNDEKTSSKNAGKKTKPTSIEKSILEKIK